MHSLKLSGVLLLSLLLSPLGSQADSYSDEDSYQLSLWVEAPEWDPVTGSPSDYLSGLVSFISQHPSIRRVMIRLQDPASVASVYYFPGAKVGSAIIKPEDTLIGGLLLNPDFIKTGVEVYVVPWIYQKPADKTHPAVWDAMTYPMPPPALGVTPDDWNALPDNLLRSGQWIALINQYLAQQTPAGVPIKGLVYESEDAGQWSDKNLALTQFSKALTTYLSTGSVPYTNAYDSPFVIASASQFDFDGDGSGVILQKVFPQMYNLTKSLPNGGVAVDAAASWANGNSTFIPAFPNSLYTACQSNGVGDPTCMLGAPFPSKNTQGLYGFMALKSPEDHTAFSPQTPGDVNLMFSGEQAAAAENPYYWHRATLAYPNPTSTLPPPQTGLINAFGTENWKDWASLSAFFETAAKNYHSSTDPAYTYTHFALFQYNLLPVNWNSSGDLTNALGTRAGPLDTDEFSFTARQGQALALAVRPISGAGRIRLSLKGCGLSRSVTQTLPVSMTLTPSSAGTCRVRITNRRLKSGQRFSGRYIVSLKSAEDPVRVTRPDDSWAHFVRVNPDP